MQTRSVDLKPKEKVENRKKIGDQLHELDNIIKKKKEENLYPEKAIKDGKPIFSQPVIDTVLGSLKTEIEDKNKDLADINENIKNEDRFLLDKDEEMKKINSSINEMKDIIEDKRNILSNIIKMKNKNKNYSLNQSKKLFHDTSYNIHYIQKELHQKERTLNNLMQSANNMSLSIKCYKSLEEGSIRRTEKEIMTLHAMFDENKDIIMVDTEKYLTKEETDNLIAAMQSANSLQNQKNILNINHILKFDVTIEKESAEEKQYNASDNYDTKRIFIIDKKSTDTISQVQAKTFHDEKGNEIKKIRFSDIEIMDNSQLRSILIQLGLTNIKDMTKNGYKQLQTALKEDIIQAENRQYYICLGELNELLTISFETRDMFKNAYNHAINFLSEKLQPKSMTNIENVLIVEGKIYFNQEGDKYDNRKIRRAKKIDQFGEEKYALNVLKRKQKKYLRDMMKNEKSKLDSLQGDLSKINEKINNVNNHDADVSQEISDTEELEKLEEKIKNIESNTIIAANNKNYFTSLIDTLQKEAKNHESSFRKTMNIYNIRKEEINKIYDNIKETFEACQTSISDLNNDLLYCNKIINNLDLELPELKAALQPQKPDAKKKKSGFFAWLFNLVKKEKVSNVDNNQ